ncbi:MAG: hypothetical protein Q4B54_03655 [Coriobacteriales bacterium]|nr:hypothetical protein [Coriobacteriales bacterium]
MSWHGYFEEISGEDEYYIMHKQHRICEPCRQEDVGYIIRHLEPACSFMHAMAP